MSIKNRTSRAGFSLIELSIVLTVLSVIGAASLPSIASNQEKERVDVTLKRMEAVESGLHAFVRANNRLPCPSNITLALSNASYGTENGSGGACTGNATSGTARFGGVPVRVLGLPDEYGFDGWGKRFSYHVDDDATASNDIVDSDPTGGTGLTVKAQDGTNKTTGALYVLMSHGKTGNGGYASISGAQVVNNAINTTGGTYAPNELSNCTTNGGGAGGAGTAKCAAYDTTFYQYQGTVNTSDLTDRFDDIVRFKEAPRCFKWVA